MANKKSIDYSELYVVFPKEMAALEMKYDEGELSWRDFVHKRASLQAKVNRLRNRLYESSYDEEFLSSIWKGISK